ncbi:EF hand [Opisthorchis viverrini]|uniref:EF hand n=1 Tax=Opisthorchis viverrini TaxID=6198 RepID=A0A1S8WT21_OPIVI|nr:EF hand [Opisthorchis viverrini]
MFYQIDQDKSGVIDCDELRNYLKRNEFDDFFIAVSVMASKIIMRQRFLKAFDSDRDGKITFEEYRKALYKVPHTQKTYTSWHQVLHNIDKDKNGYITMDELYEVLKESGNAESTSIKDLQAFIREYDEDGDGKLNYHEFLDYLLDRPNEALV